MGILTRENHWECSDTPLSLQTRHPYFVKVFLRKFHFSVLKKLNPYSRSIYVFPKIFLRVFPQRVFEVSPVVDALHPIDSSPRQSLIPVAHPVQISPKCNFFASECHHSLFWSRQRVFPSQKCYFLEEEQKRCDILKGWSSMEGIIRLFLPQNTGFERQRLLSATPRRFGATNVCFLPRNVIFWKRNKKDATSLKDGALWRA